MCFSQNWGPMREKGLSSYIKLLAQLLAHRLGHGDRLNPSDPCIGEGSGYHWLKRIRGAVGDVEVKFPNPGRSNACVGGHGACIT